MIRTTLLAFCIIAAARLRSQDQEPIVKLESVSIHTVQRGRMALFASADGSLTSLQPPRAVLEFTNGNPGRCEAGRSARLVIDGPRAFAGKVVRGLEEAAARGRCEVEFVDPFPAGAEVGKRVRALIEAGEMKDVIFFGRPAGSSEYTTATIFLLDPTNSSARRVSVRYGKRSGPLIQVIDGLKPGDRVIVTDMSEWAHAPRVRIQ